jgi:hypothetical protein
MESVGWERYGTVGEYVIWQVDDVYNVTSGEPPFSDSGYYDLEALLRLKGLRFTDVVLDAVGYSSLPLSPRI